MNEKAARRTRTLEIDPAALRRALTPSGRAMLRGLVRLGSSRFIGRLEITLPHGAAATLGGVRPGPEATLCVRDRAFGGALVRRGAMGLAEGYMHGAWDTPDLCGVLDFAASNVARHRPLRLPSAAGLLHRFEHVARANTKRGAARNIQYHYDLGNDFYQLWLDPTLTYSAALFSEADDSLERAQVRKWDRLLGLINPAPGSTLLEIGSGWGGFAVHAARTRDVRVTSVTISREQHDLACQRVADAGLNDRVEIRLQDYRDIRETFDAIASIEMFEAVGERYWPDFFACVHDRLGPRGVAGIQVITIANNRFDVYRHKADFAQKYIFPGGMLPSPNAFSAAAERAGLSVGEPFTFGHDYARTLEAWLEAFDAAHREVTALGFDERFVRMWRYYLAYCRAGFRNETVDVMQVALRRS